MMIACFSCGVTSAVACKIALSLYEDVQLYYIETGSGHLDNVRFLADCEKWYNQSIHIIRSDKYTCVSDVLRSGILMVRMVLLPNGGVIRYSTIKHK